MVLFSHMLVGAAIGSKIHSFWAIFVLALVSHFLFDRLPHWEYGRRFGHLLNSSPRQLLFFSLEVSLDLFLGLAIVFWLAWSSPARWLILFGALISLLPDGLIFIFIFLRRSFNWEVKCLEKFYFFHHKIHIPENKNPFVWGIITEALIVILSIYFIPHLF
jgi:hypothetical protein